ncbi:MAG: hypothetical protein PHF41_04985 [Massilibacteroides sp.]|nr:hypothetical protein [Massilibacteroides sp.]
MDDIFGAFGVLVCKDENPDSTTILRRNNSKLGGIGERLRRNNAV